MATGTITGPNGTIAEGSLVNFTASTSKLKGNEYAFINVVATGKAKDGSEVIVMDALISLTDSIYLPSQPCHVTATLGSYSWPGGWRNSWILNYTMSSVVFDVPDVL